ncbi:wax ester/triacylglycerol synthase family O-acyltransferase [Nocardia sp. XZ_19_385]|uniref:WS/DGAT/MGAT family O-acyltransferase n=1 Tax=Nocardia sp. XZ_19_385 TaxID=2769488 RepID=UPI00188FB81C|nr:wax ester/triacylglycerol synthase family O-acyltransferase [Nocardia sp. XZ_19_385]
MERLSGYDSTFLFFETPTQHQHFVGLTILNPDTEGANYTFESFKAELQRRLPLVPQFRKRVYPVPFNLGRPVWADDPNFEIDNHIRRIQAPAPGGRRELAELAAAAAGTPMRRDRPLWEWLLVEGLEDGRVALIQKYQHSMMDGFTGSQIRFHMCELEPGAHKEVPADTWKPEPTPTGRQLLLGSLRSIPAKLRFFALLIATVRILAAGSVRRLRTPKAERISMKAPRAPWNRAISAERAVSFVKTDLAEVKEIKNAFGVKVNDVVLAVAGGALRRYLEKHDALPDLSLVAVVPINGHEVSQLEEVINQNGVMRSTLGTDIADPVQRLHRVAESTRRAKSAYVGIDFLLTWAEYFPANFLNLVTRLVSSLRVADHIPMSGPQNLTVSNVPGWFAPLYTFGLRIEASYPFAQVMHGNGLLAAVLSNNGDMDWGFIACKELMPDIEELAESVPLEVAELLSAARALA